MTQHWLSLPPAPIHRAPEVVAQVRRRRPCALTAREVKAMLWPIARRIPAYVRLGWALVRDPAVPRRHKALLVTAAVYTISPAHLLLSAVPVVGQLDSVVLLLAGLRQALVHCPDAVRKAHLARLRLSPTQLQDDLDTVWYVAECAMRAAGTSTVDGVRFAGRVATGFVRRRIARVREAPANSRATIRPRPAPRRDNLASRFQRAGA